PDERARPVRRVRRIRRAHLRIVRPVRPVCFRAVCFRAVCLGGRRPGTVRLVRPVSFRADLLGIDRPEGVCFRAARFWADRRRGGGRV
ncbi:hypothetical protein, partial [Actinomadura sp. WAC 06369]|uniref:hypothetical protein n=1 Tax=Actinomadura sp. WAC 06369 TaxID=2203193 RepID=UPI001315345A